MKIKVTDIKEEGLKVDFDDRIEIDHGGAQDVGFSASIYLLKSGTTIYVVGKTHATMHQTCSRCLDEFDSDIDFEFSLSCSKREGREGPRSAEREVASDEIDECHYDEEIDLSELVREQIVVNVPMKPLCSDQCKGLCGVCGCNLNTGVCTCREETVDDRWKVLKKITAERKG